MTRFVNLMLYQLGWFACVLGISWDFQWLGTCIALCLVGAHFLLAADRSLQIKLALFAGAFGLIVDTVQIWAGVFEFPRGAVVEWLPPPGITVLWMQFATTFRYSMSWLSGRYALSACFGLLGAPLAFLAGEKLGAVEFLSPRILHYFVLGLVWSVSVSLLVYVSDRLASRAAVGPIYRWPTVQRARSQPDRATRKA